MTGVLVGGAKRTSIGKEVEVAVQPPAKEAITSMLPVVAALPTVKVTVLPVLLVTLQEAGNIHVCVAPQIGLTEKVYVPFRQTLSCNRELCGKAPAILVGAGGLVR